MRGRRDRLGRLHGPGERTAVNRVDIERGDGGGQRRSLPAPQRRQRDIHLSLNALLGVEQTLAVANEKQDHGSSLPTALWSPQLWETGHRRRKGDKSTCLFAAGE